MKMLISHMWLQTLFNDELPSHKEIEKLLLLHIFEVEGIEKIGDDFIYELDILANRPDCLSHYGIAREISAITGVSLKKEYLKKEYSKIESEEYINTENCDRYAVLHLKDIDPTKMPNDMKKFLLSVGQNSIHPMVDISNYILFLLGQPTHAFDASKISGLLGVRQAKNGEELTLLGGDVISLKETDCVITDKDKAIALAGVKGGEDTKVDDNTKDVYLEIATFNNVSVRNTSRRLGMSTDASQRFSQGISPELLGYVINDIIEICSTFSKVERVSDSKRTPLRNIRKTGVSANDVNKIAGTSYNDSDIENVLKSYGYEYEIVNPREKFIESLRSQLGKPYKWASSISYDATDSFDCSSLISWAAAQAGKSIPRISINQYLSSEHVEEPKIGDLVFSSSIDESMKKHTKHIFEEGYYVSPGVSKIGINHVGVLTEENLMLEANGVSEEGKVVEKAFTKEKKEKCIFGSIWEDEKRFAIKVPIERTDINSQLDLVEEVIRFKGLENIPTNIPEVGGETQINKEYAKQLYIQNALTNIGFIEIFTSSFVSNGDVELIYPVAKDKSKVRKSLIDQMKVALKENSYFGELLEVGNVMLFEIGNVFSKENEHVKLCLGIKDVPGNPKIKESKVEEMVKDVLPINGGFKDGVWEVDLKDLDINPKSYIIPSNISDVQFEMPSKYPFILRDVAVFVPNDVSSEMVKKIIMEKAGPYIKIIRLFDIFEKDDRVSYAFRLVFQSNEKTLGDKTIFQYVEDIYSSLTNKGYEIR